MTGNKISGATLRIGVSSLMESSSSHFMLLFESASSNRNAFRTAKLKTTLTRNRLHAKALKWRQMKHLILYVVPTLIWV